MPAPEGEADDDKAPDLSQHGLLMVITDDETDQQTLRRIEFAVQRPSRFLKAVAAYHSPTRQVRIRFEALHLNAIPEDGLRVKLDFAEFDIKGTSINETSLTPKMLTPTNDEVVHLFAPVPLDEQDEVTARVSVDGYPRAFVFRVPCRETTRSIPPLFDLTEIRIEIVASDQGHAYPANMNEVHAKVEIDAPRSAFSLERGTDFVEVGIDANRSRDFDVDDRGRDFNVEEQTLRLLSDRQVNLPVQSLDTDGSLRVETRVNDFEITLPVGGLNNTRALRVGTTRHRGVVDVESTR